MIPFKWIITIVFFVPFLSLFLFFCRSEETRSCDITTCEREKALVSTRSQRAEEENRGKTKIMTKLKFEFD